MLVSTVDMGAAIDLVASRMRSVDRQKIKVDIETALKVLRAGKAWINLDKALRMVVDFWKALVYDTSTSRLEALFASADSDQNGELDFQEFIDIVDKVNSQGFSAMSGRSTLRMYSQMSLHERVDASKSEVLIECMAHAPYTQTSLFSRAIHSHHLMHRPLCNLL